MHAPAVLITYTCMYHPHCTGDRSVLISVTTSTHVFLRGLVSLSEVFLESDSREGLIPVAGATENPLDAE